MPDRWCFSYSRDSHKVLWQGWWDHNLLCDQVIVVMLIKIIKNAISNPFAFSDKGETTEPIVHPEVEEMGEAHSIHSFFWRDSNHGAAGTGPSSGKTPLDLDVGLVNAFIRRKQTCSHSCTEPFLFHPLSFICRRRSTVRLTTPCAELKRQHRQGKFLHISTSNMIANVSTSLEGFGGGRQLLWQGIWR